MCGLCGVVGPYLDVDHTRKFRELLIVSMLRGMDSTGVIRVTKKDNKFWFQSHKTLGTPTDFMYDIAVESKAHSGILDSGSRMLMGHTRLASIGKVTVDNAHPFRHKGILGMHNGTIVKHFEGRNGFDTDSEALYSYLSNHTIDETLKEIQSGTTAYALTYYDMPKNSIHFVRNDKRDLYFARTDKAIFWASEERFLNMVLSDVKEREITKLEPYMFMSIDLDDPLNKPKLRKIDVPLYVPPPVQHWRQSGNRGLNTRDYGRRSHSHWDACEFPWSAEDLESDASDYIDPLEDFEGNNREIMQQQNDLAAADPKTSALQPDDPLIVTKDGVIKTVSRSSSSVPEVKPLSKQEIKRKLQEDRKNDKLSKTLFWFDGFLGPLSRKPERLSRGEFEKILARGCAYCGEADEIRNFKKLVFINSNQYVCSDCLSKKHDPQGLTKSYVEKILGREVTIE